MSNAGRGHKHEHFMASVSFLFFKLQVYIITLSVSCLVSLFFMPVIHCVLRDVWLCVDKRSDSVTLLKLVDSNIWAHADTNRAEGFQKRLKNDLSPVTAGMLGTFVADSLSTTDSFYVFNVKLTALLQTVSARYRDAWKCQLILAMDSRVRLYVCVTRARRSRCVIKCF